jgi:hypothetical protein
MFCAQCGKAVPDGAKFCSHCGAATAAVSPEAPAPMSAAAIAPRPAPMAGAPGSSGPVPGYIPPVGDAAHGLIARVKNILLAPGAEWPVIAAESSSAGSIYMGYVAPLVAIGVIAAFIGQSAIGLPIVGRVGVVAGLIHAIISFVFSLLGVFVIAWIVDILAPTFGGQRDSLAALKATAYSFTPGWVAGVLNIVPMLGLLVIVGALYGLYLLYLGLPVVMRCPREKAVGYTVVTVLCAIVMGIVLSILTTCVVGGLGLMGIGAMSRIGTHSDRASTADAAAVLSNVFGGKSDSDKARVNDALKTLEKMGEQAQQADKATRAGSTGTQGTAAAPADVGAALGAVGRIMAGGKDVQPVDFHKLKDMLPESLPGMQRKEAEGQSGEAMGLKGSSATARYSDAANGSITIEIADVASLSGLAGLANKFDPNMEKETDTGYERTRRVDGQLVHERYDRRSRSGEVGILLADRFAITVRGNGVDPEALTSALKQVDLTRLASAAR